MRTGNDGKRQRASGHKNGGDMVTRRTGRGVRDGRTAIRTTEYFSFPVEGTRAWHRVEVVLFPASWYHPVVAGAKHPH